MYQIVRFVAKTFQYSCPGLRSVAAKRLSPYCDIDRVVGKASGRDEYGASGRPTTTLFSQNNPISRAKWTGQYEMVCTRFFCDPIEVDLPIRLRTKESQMRTFGRNKLAVHNRGTLVYPAGSIVAGFFNSML